MLVKWDLREIMMMYPGILWGTAPFQQTPLFVAPLTNSLNATKGTNVFTFAVATSFGNNGGFVSDWENNLRRCKPQEARFTGARRVENLINGHSENLTNPSWLKYNAGAGSAAAVVTANYTTSPLGGSTASRVQLNMGTDTVNGVCQLYQAITNPNTSYRTFRTTFWLKSLSGTPTISFGIGTQNSVTITGSWVRYTVPVAVVAGATAQLNFGLFGTTWNPGNSPTADIAVWGVMLEDISGQSDQDPGEYVSLGVLIAPWHGCNVDGVKCFNTLNGNTVAGSVVTEAVGLPITTLNGASPLTCDRTAPIGLLKEMEQTQVTNFFTEYNFNSWQYKTGITVAEGDAAPCPTGEQLGSGIIEDGTTNYHYLSHGLTGLTGASVHIIQNCFIAPGVRFSVLLRMSHPSFTWSCDQIFSLSGNGSLTGGQSVGGAVTPRGSGIIPCRGGWFRCWQAMTIPDPTGLAIGVAIMVNGGASYAGSNGQTALYVYGHALQDMSNYGDWFPPSYSALPRGKDSLSFQAASNMNTAQGTAYAEIKTGWDFTTQHRPIISFAGPTDSGLFISNANAVSTSIAIGDGTNVASKGGILTPRIVPRKVASSWGNGGAFIRATGSGAIPAVAAFDGAMGSTAIGLGSQGTSATTQPYNLNGNIRNVIIYGVPASNNELMNLTAGDMTAAELVLLLGLGLVTTNPIEPSLMETEQNDQSK